MSVAEPIKTEFARTRARRKMTMDVDRRVSEALLKTVVIIPALNEQESLPMVLRDLPDVARVFVVDNGCTDATAEVAVSGGATVVTESTRGYGAACLAGIAAAERLAASNPDDVHFVAFVDADYSDHVDMIHDLMESLIRSNLDFVLGSRLLGQREPGAMPPQSVFGNHLACFLMRILLGAKFTDLGPMRLIRLDALRELKMVDRNFGWTIEMQIKAVRHRLRIREIGVPYRRRIGTSKISGTLSGTVRAGTKIIWSIWRYGLSRNRDR